MLNHVLTILAIIIFTIFGALAVTLPVVLLALILGIIAACTAIERYNVIYVLIATLRGKS